MKQSRVRGYIAYDIATKGKDAAMLVVRVNDATSVHDGKEFVVNAFYYMVSPRRTGAPVSFVIAPVVLVNNQQYQEHILMAEGVVFEENPPAKS